MAQQRDLRFTYSLHNACYRKSLEDFEQNWKTFEKISQKVHGGGGASKNKPFEPLTVNP
ncbi:hypothetical protein PSYJYH_000079 [Bacillus phage PSYJ-YH]|nr:hypothetical protein PSYJYH_000079 [Bacillus phage PSYJ-YH]